MTNLIYLQDTYKFQAMAKVANIQTTEDGRTAILLDETIFYPQGGGQPCDIGTISNDEAIFNVNDVRMDKDGSVLHMGSFEKGQFALGDNVTLNIDQDRRIKNAKAHSAGHLIDCAVIQLGLPLNPTKGYHFPEGPNVEYEGEIENSPEILEKLQNSVNELISKKIQVVTYALSSQEAAKQNLFVPVGKKARIVNFEGFNWCGCGGTHIRSSNEIGQIIIRKIKTKNKITKISYEVL
jgi:Ser-tRNA(Ala) deacylase AlaX